MADMKHCPFCGAEAEHLFCHPDGKFAVKTATHIYGKFTSHHIIRCKKCGVQTKVYATTKGAFNSWNRRITNESERN